MTCTTQAHEIEAPPARAGAAPGQKLAPAAATVRATLLDGLVSPEAFAEGADKCIRVVRMWMAQGMPTVYIGRTPYIPIAEAKDWLLRRKTRNEPPRGRGRPRKAA